MRSIRSRLSLRACLAALALACAGTANASYPERPITLVVPNAAGGPTDAIARSVGQKLAARLGQTVVIDNRGGAGGTIAAEYVVHAKADGYTLFLATTGTLAINPALYQKLRYDAQKDFEPIALLSTTSNVLVVRNDLPARSVKDLVALAKRDPELLSYASSGNGASNHLAAELFKTLTGAQIRHVPYKAASPQRIDLWEGRVDLLFSPEGSAMKDLTQSGKARALMVSGKSRSSLFPDVPTAEESGIKGYDIMIWFGLVAPAGTPAAIVERLNKEVVSILATPDMLKELASDGQTARPMTNREFGAFLAQERQKWVPVVKASGAKVE